MWWAGQLVDAGTVWADLNGFATVSLRWRNEPDAADIPTPHLIGPPGLQPRHRTGLLGRTGPTTTMQPGQLAMMGSGALLARNSQTVLRPCRFS